MTSRSAVVFNALMLALLLAVAAGCSSGSGANVWQAALSGDTEHVQNWLAEGGDPNAINPATNGTVLEAAVSGSSMDCVRVLLEAGADPMAENGFGATVFSAVAGVGTAEITDTLLRAAEGRISIEDLGVHRDMARFNDNEEAAAVFDRYIGN